MRDIDYFTEEKLDRSTFLPFKHELPDHLRGFLKNGRGVLQGYRGPTYMQNNSSGTDSQTLNSSYGVQEIRFWHGTSKNAHYVPVVGTIIFGIGRGIESLINSSDWQTVYFDENSGRALSSLEAQSQRHQNYKIEIDNAQARVLNKRAQLLWNEAWAAEESENVDEAKEKFEQASTMFKDASELDSGNSEYQKFTHISGLKIEGNEFFNHGVELHHNASHLKEKLNYQEARDTYQQAKEKFQQGFEASDNNLRFKTCVDLVQECIDEINETIKSIQLNAGKTNARDDESDKNREQTTSTFGIIESFKKFKP